MSFYILSCVLTFKNQAKKKVIRSRHYNLRFEVKVVGRQCPVSKVVFELIKFGFGTTLGNNK